MTGVTEKPRTGGPGSGLGGAWRVIVLNDDHNTFDHVAATLARVIPGISLDRGYKLGMPTSVAAATAAPIIWAEKKINKATPDAVQADLAAVPGLLDHVDGLIAQGVIGGDQPNAADFQIAASVRLLMVFDQLLPLIAGRPAEALALKVVP